MNFFHKKMIETLSKDKTMAKIIDLVPSERLHLKEANGMVREDLISSIISQQLAVKAARVIHQRFLDLFPKGFPSNKKILETSVEDLRSSGLSGQKASYILNIAEHFHNNKWKNEDFHEMENEDIITKLTAIKGVGRWTSEMVLIFCLAKPDVFAVDDLGIQNAMIQFFKLEGSKKEILTAMQKRSEKWKPFRSAASLYLWAARDLKIEI
ncbi:MAG: DNA-3-methyladenine glycosylase 2 family protein [Saprospiraceae bacterium]|nr:DNA-3-methyladenine glycosylase 2 family protein [Saprospiraceae bacterium]